MSNPFTRLRIIGTLEGLSFLLLLGIAMPLKYIWGQPLAVKYTGWAHGVLFVAYVLAVFPAAEAGKWNLKRIATAIIASLLPAGPFFLDGKLKQDAGGHSQDD